MIKQMAIVKKKPGMTDSEYYTYIEHVHGSMSRKYNPGTLIKYTQNHVFDSIYGRKTDKTFVIPTGYTSVTELYFDDLAGMGACFSDPNIVKYIAQDGQYFADESMTITSVVEEKEVAVPNPRANGIKVIYSFKKAAGISDEEFLKKLDEYNEAIIPTIPGICRYVQNVPLGIAGNTSHFKNANDFVFEGSVAIWVEFLDDFRKYQEALEARADGFFDPSASFCLCVNEKYII